MLPGATVPSSLADLLAVFRPCFTAPTFPTFVGLLVGLIAQTRGRTVCGMLTGAGLDQIWHHSRAHRLFSNARWSGDALGLVLADLIVARLLPADSAVTIAVDDTLVQTVRQEGLRCGLASRRRREGPETDRVRQLLGRGRHRGAATVSVSPGVPAGAGPAVATPAHREDRVRPRAGRVDRRPLPRPDGARGRGRRLRRGTPARRGRPDHLDQPVEGAPRCCTNCPRPAPDARADHAPVVPGWAPRPMSPPSRRARTRGAPPGSAGTAAPTPCRSPNGSVSGTDRFAAEPCVSFWSATTNVAPATVTIAVTAFRW